MTVTLQTAAPVSSRSRTARASGALGWLLLAGVMVQLYTVGLGVFGAASFKWHALVGWVLMPVALLAAVTSAVASGGSPETRWVIVALLLTMLQPVLALWPPGHSKLIAAVHPLTGMGVGIATWSFLRLRSHD